MSINDRTVIVTATLASVGTAAVPGVGLVTLAMVLAQALLRRRWPTGPFFA